MKVSERPGTAGDNETGLNSLKNFIELSGEPFCQLNNEGICVFVNHAFELLSGYSKKELTKKPFIQLIKPTDAETALAAFSAEKTFSFISGLLTKTGREETIEWRGIKDKSGISLLAKRRNQTDKGEIFSSVSASVPVVIYLLNLAEEKLEFVNEHVFALSGYTVEECMTMDKEEIFGLVAQQDLPQLIQSFSRLVLDPKMQMTGNSFRIRHKDGELRRVTSRDTVYKRDAKGNVTHLLGAITDVTEQFNSERYREAITRLKEIQQKRTQKIRSLSLLQGQEEERKRLARELHDGIGQLLTAVRIKLNDIEEKTGSEMLDKQIADVKALVLKTIKEARNISYALVPIDLYDFGLEPSVRQLCDTAALNTGLNVSFSSNLNNERVNPTIEIELYRIIQEALNNSIKYSDAASIDINLIHNEKQGSLKVLVIDDGNGFDYDPDYIYKKNKTRSFGLRNMNERTRIINGKLNIISRKGEGCVISVEVPLKLNEI